MSKAEEANRRIDSLTEEVKYLRRQLGEVCDECDIKSRRGHSVLITNDSEKESEVIIIREYNQEPMTLYRGQSTIRRFTPGYQISLEESIKEPK